MQIIGHYGKVIDTVFMEQARVYISDIQRGLNAFVTEHHEEDDDDNTDLVIHFDEDVTAHPVTISLDGHGRLQIEFTDSGGAGQYYMLT